MTDAIEAIGESLAIVVVACLVLLLLVPRRFGGFANGGGPIARGQVNQAHHATSTPVRSFRDLFVSAPELALGWLKMFASKHDIELVRPGNVHGSIADIEAHLNLPPLQSNDPTGPADDH